MKVDTSYDEIYCYVYILRCDRINYYTGLTNDIERRIKEHRTTKTGYTKKFKIKEVEFLYKLDNRREARKVEVYIKRIGAKAFLMKYEKSLKLDQRTLLYNTHYLNTIKSCIGN
jgi:putative endonuclease